MKSAPIPRCRKPTWAAMTMSEPLIEARGLHAYYGASHILHGVDFTVRRGETVGLMGRNGMGKTTLLRSVLGLVRPRAGEVRIAGALMTEAAPYAIARKGIAYVPEGRGIFPNLSVRENLVMAARAGAHGRRDWSFERVMQTFPRLAERLGHGGAQIWRRAADADHRARAYDQSRCADPRRGDRRPGAEDLARNLGHHRPDQAGRDRGGDRGQELRRRVRRRRSRADPGERCRGVRGQHRGVARAAGAAGEIPGRVRSPL